MCWNQRYDASVWCRISGVLQSKMTVRTNKEQREDDNELIDSVSEDVLCHGAGDERLVPAIWLPLQQRLCGRLCCQGQGCKSIHDQVYPQHLHCLQGRVLRKCKRICNKSQSMPMTSFCYSVKRWYTAAVLEAKWNITLWPYGEFWFVKICL